MKFLKLTAAVLALVAFTGCSDDDENGDGDGDGDNTGATTTLDVTESKEFLEDTFTELSDLLNKEDQQEVIDYLTEFAETFEDFEFPDFEDFGFNAPARIAAEMARNLKAGNYVGATAAMHKFHYDLTKMNGTYSPNYKTEEWEKVSDSNDLVFTWKNKSGQTAEIRVSATGEGANVEWYEEYYDGYWDYEADTWVDEDAEYSVVFPASTTVTMSNGGKSLANATAKTAFSSSKGTLTVDADATIANINCHATANGTNTAINGNTTMTISGKPVLTGTATVKGKQLLANNRYSEEFIEDDLFPLIESGNGESDVLGRVQVKGSMSNYKTLADDLDFYYYCYDGDMTQEQAKAAAQAACGRLMQHVKADLYFGSDIKQAELVFGPYIDSWGDESWDLWINPMIKFLADGTTYEFEDYFTETRFADVIDQIEALLEAYGIELD